MPSNRLPGRAKGCAISWRTYFGWRVWTRSLPPLPPAQSTLRVSPSHVPTVSWLLRTARHHDHRLTRMVLRFPIVFAPAEWLDRLVSVLLDNACRYANDGGQVDVTVSAEGERVVLVVDDSGPGITEADRESIFQRFHRASDVPGGAGLGLSIADAIVKATAGDWTVTKAPVGGARIAVSWPRHRREGTRGPPSTAEAVKRSPPCRVSAHRALGTETEPPEGSEG